VGEAGGRLIQSPSKGEFFTKLSSRALSHIYVGLRFCSELGRFRKGIALFLFLHECGMPGNGGWMTTRTNTTARKNGSRRAKVLKQAALKQVEENALAIVDCLVEGSKQGHALSARLLMDLAEGEAEVEEAVQKRPLLTLRARLEAEPKSPKDAPIEPWDDEDAATEVKGKAFVTA
jgi:hypothetical protein